MALSSQIIQLQHIIIDHIGRSHHLDRMVVGFTTTCTIKAYHH